jgi:hypothetical protein
VLTISALAIDLEPLINSALHSGWVVCNRCFRSASLLLKRRSQLGQTSNGIGEVVERKGELR